MKFLAMRVSGLCAILLAFCAGMTLWAAAARAEVVGMPEDAAMRQAYERARASLPQFKTLLETDRGGYSLLKVGIPHSDGVEHIWIEVRSVSGDVFYGAFVNDGVSIPYRIGDPYQATREEVSDWLFFASPSDSGPVHGGYTVRLIIEQYPDSHPPEFVQRLQPLR